MEVTEESGKGTGRGREETRGLGRFRIQPSTKSALLNIYFSRNFAPIVEKRVD